MIQASLKLISFIVIILLVGCNQNGKVREQFSIELRQKFKSQFIVLPEINYNKVLGRKPRLEEIELGRQLFSDPILSRNNDVSCATCHLTNHGFSDGNPLNVGTMGKGGPTGDNVGHHFGTGTLSLNRHLGQDGNGFNALSYMFRNSLSTVNVGHRIDKANDRGLFWDGRFGKLTFQVLLPIHTGIEMCGRNPVTNQNPFVKGGKYFETPIQLKHVNTFDSYLGKDLGAFNASAIKVNGIPTYRPSGSMSIPGRNECLAIAIAKLRTVPYYVNKFKKLYNSEIKDNLLAFSLASFVITHVSKDTNYDQFIEGKNTLSVSELKGLATFFTPIGESMMLGKHKIQGAGCIKCHDGATFGGRLTSSLGVRTDSRSSLTQVTQVRKTGSSFFSRIRVNRGYLPKCHVDGVSATDQGYVPDIGVAGASFKLEDCFKFRVPPLRNIIETYPYFHSGTANGKGEELESLTLIERSRVALGQAVKYHLSGPINALIYSRNRKTLKSYFDNTFQKDFLIPYSYLNFYDATNEEFKTLNYDMIFPIKLTEDNFNGLIDFISISLFDKNSTSIGSLGNDLSHPKVVPSGFTPTITRDNGNQMELPPASIH